MAEPTSSAITGGKKLIEFFISRAREAERHFIAGPVWNTADRLIGGRVQFLRYTLRGSPSNEACFSTEELEKYSNDDANVTKIIEQKIPALLMQAT